MQATVLLLFIRYPEPGTVKTRLGARIGADKAAELYRNFILDSLATLEKSGLPLRICYAPIEKKTALMAWLGPKYQIAPQEDADLGVRMLVAFKEAFREGFKRAILVGSDVPDLPLAVLKEAVEVLQQHDAVIGPAVDGGYYLIGLQKESLRPDVFDGIPWGTAEVLRETLTRLRDLGLQVHLLPEWRDVDTFEDLAPLRRRAQDSDFSTSRTAAYLSEMDLERDR